MKANDKIHLQFETLSAEMLAADASDKDAIIQIGSAAEQALALVAEGSQSAGLLQLVLTALQKIYQETVVDLQGTMDAAVEAIAAISQYLASESAGIASLDEAVYKLQTFLTEEAAAADQATDQANDNEKAPAEGKTADESAEEKPMFDGPAILPDDTDADLMSEYIVECLDHITAAEGSLLELEGDPTNDEPINRIFRAFHTIKGTSGFLGLDRVQRLAHLAESLLDRGREGEIQITGGYADLSLKSCDLLRSMIEDLHDAEPGQELEIPEQLDELLENLTHPEAAGFGYEVTTEVMRLGDILVAKGQAERKDVEEVAKNQDGKPIGTALAEKGVVAAQDVAQAIRTQKRISGRAAATDTTIRVATNRLDDLINMIGELVIAHSMVVEDPDVSSGASPRLVRNITHAGKIIRELQDLSMSLRMVPLKGTFQKMARLVRDLSRKAGKSVQFVTEGDDTEIDRNMVEVLNDPLIHMMRNAVDHGIETTDKRITDGKLATGTVSLKAFHSAGNVVIELTDDGKGLDRDRILSKAIERGLIEQGREISDNDIFEMIFQAGFSTAEKITDVSGRGVGMDVVKKNIDALRGRIEVASEIGKGSSFTVRVPLTMAITDAMLLRVGQEHYLLPTGSIEHSFRPTAEAVSSVAGRGEQIMLRGNLLPIFRLYELFNIAGAATEPGEALLIVIEAEGRRCALMVDELLGQQQVVIKSLGEKLGHIPGVAGGSILGDGNVGLILDASGLLDLAHEGCKTQQAATLVV